MGKRIGGSINGFYDDFYDMYIDYANGINHILNDYDKYTNKDDFLKDLYAFQRQPRFYLP
jgi:hypothetical protein